MFFSFFLSFSFSFFPFLFVLTLFIFLSVPFFFCSFAKTCRGENTGGQSTQSSIVFWCSCRTTHAATENGIWIKKDLKKQCPQNHGHASFLPSFLPCSTALKQGKPKKPQKSKAKRSHQRPTKKQKPKAKSHQKPKAKRSHQRPTKKQKPKAKSHQKPTKKQKPKAKSHQKPKATSKNKKNKKKTKKKSKNKYPSVMNSPTTPPPHIPHSFAPSIQLLSIPVRLPRQEVEPMCKGSINTLLGRQRDRSIPSGT